MKGVKKAVKVAKSVVTGVKMSLKGVKKILRGVKKIVKRVKAMVTLPQSGKNSLPNTGDRLFPEKSKGFS